MSRWERGMVRCRREGRISTLGTAEYESNHLYREADDGSGNRVERKEEEMQLSAGGMRLTCWSFKFVPSSAIR